MISSPVISVRITCPVTGEISAAVRTTGSHARTSFQQSLPAGVMLWALVLLFITLAQGVAAQSEPGGIRLRLSDDLDASDARAEAAESERTPRSLWSRYQPRLSGLQLEMTLSTKHDDNVLRSASNERASMIVQAKPRAILAGRVGRHGFEVGYQADYARYLEEPDENYEDHELIADGELRLTRRLRVLLDNGMKFGHDRRGDIGSRPAGADIVSRQAGADEPDRWRKHHAGGEVRFGRASAKVLQTKAEIGGSYKVEGIRYINNDQSSRDFDDRTFGLTGQYNLGPRLSLVGDIGLTFIDYLDPATRLDSRETSILVGVAWKATAKTTGKVQVGKLFKDFFDPGQSDFAGNNWKAQVDWAPKTFSVWSFYAQRDTAESGQGGGTAVTDTTGVRWNHAFTKKLIFDAKAQFAQTDFASNRSDDLVDVGAALSYQVNRWARVRGGLDHSYRESTDAGSDFDNSVVFLELIANFDRRLGRRLERN